MSSTNCVTFLVQQVQLVTVPCLPPQFPWTLRSSHRPSFRPADTVANLKCVIGSHHLLSNEYSLPADFKNRLLITLMSFVHHRSTSSSVSMSLQLAAFVSSVSGRRDESTAPLRHTKKTLSTIIFKHPQIRLVDSKTKIDRPH